MDAATWYRFLHQTASELAAVPAAELALQLFLTCAHSASGECAFCLVSIGMEVNLALQLLLACAHSASAVVLDAAALLMADCKRAWLLAAKTRHTADCAFVTLRVSIHCTLLDINPS